ncbi:MAG: YgjV family protein [Oscillospiraceae bacterium]|nr:YgjV family protein [Oscillospiraceae bacterium]
MTTSQIIEAVGYLGSTLVLVSFLMASVVKLRIVNSVGSAIFAVYALIIRSYPTAIMNICLLLINIYYLWKLRKTAPEYRMVTLSPGEGYVRFFLDSHREDIAACFPGRSWDSPTLDRAWLVCHGEEPAGLLLGEEKDGVLDVALDYSTPAYRDCSVGSFLLEHLPKEELRALRYAGAEEGHLAYLKKMGYREEDGAYVREL